MPLRDSISPAPREVRLAGLLTAAPGLALLVFAFVLGLSTGDSALTGGAVLAEIIFYIVLAAGVLACAAGLLLGKTWARSPSVVVSLMVVGVGWYATGPSHQPGFGVPAILAGAVVLILLFKEPSRAWVLGQLEGESEEEASHRGGVAGRAADRERRGD